MSQQAFKHFKAWKQGFGIVSVFFFILAGCNGESSEIPGDDTPLQENPPPPPPPEGGASETLCKTQRMQFHQEAWGPLFARCQGCHSASGFATLHARSNFVLVPDSFPDATQRNLETIASFAKKQANGTSDLLTKVSDKELHPDGITYEKGSPEYVQLKNFIEKLENAQLDAQSPFAVNCRNMPARMDARLRAVPLLDANASFRKAAINIGGRLPKPEEMSRLSQSPAELPALINALLEEEGFYERLKEVFNDMFVFPGKGESSPLFARGHFDYELNASSGYGKGRDFPKIDELFVGEVGKNRGPETGLSFHEEPLELIVYIAKNNRPFSEILTADYIVTNPYTAYAYGLINEMPEPIVSMRDWSRYSEPLVQRKGLGLTGALAETIVPRAGVLSTPAFLVRWSSTATNLSRGRAEFLSKNFLATSILGFAQRPVNSTELGKTDGEPTKSLPACQVCHDYMDPLASGFMGFTYSRLASYQPQSSEWGMKYAPGFLDKTPPHTLPKTRILPWMAQQITEDARFPYAMVRRVFESVTGNKPVEYSADPLSLAAWESQNAFLHEVASQMAAQGMNIKVAFREILLSPYFRAAQTPNLPADLALGLGEGKLLTPEVLARKIRAILGTHWGYSFPATGNNPPQHRDFLPFDYNVLYGGIDSRQSPERIREINTMIAAVASAMAREMGCRIPAWEFSKPTNERILLAKVQMDTKPFRQDSPGGPWIDVPEAERAIRENLSYLHQRLLGENVEPNSPEVDIAYALFADVWKERAKTNNKKIEHTNCQGKWDLGQQIKLENITASTRDNNNGYVPLPALTSVTQDEHFTFYAWQAVLTYLLTDFRFLHE